jgi:hypothetical protein
MTPGFVTATSPLQVRLAGAASTSYAMQLGGGTLSVDDKVFCFQVAIGSRSQLAVMAVV